MVVIPQKWNNNSEMLQHYSSFFSEISCCFLFAYIPSLLRNKFPCKMKINFPRSLSGRSLGLCDVLWVIQMFQLQSRWENFCSAKSSDISISMELVLWRINSKLLQSSPLQAEIDRSSVGRCRFLTPKRLVQYAVYQIYTVTGMCNYPKLADRTNEFSNLWILV